MRFHLSEPQPGLSLRLRRRRERGMEAKGHGCGGPREGLSVRAGRGWEQGAGQAGVPGGGARPETLMTVPQTSGHEALKDETSSSCRNVRTTAKLGGEGKRWPPGSGPLRWGRPSSGGGKTRLCLASITRH